MLGILSDPIKKFLNTPLLSTEIYLVMLILELIDYKISKIFHTKFIIIQIFYSLSNNMHKKRAQYCG